MACVFELHRGCNQLLCSTLVGVTRGCRPARDLQNPSLDMMRGTVIFAAEISEPGFAVFERMACIAPRISYYIVMGLFVSNDADCHCLPP